MLFNSDTYIFYFLPIVFSVYFYLNHKRLLTLSKGFILLASLVFYSWWKIEYLPLLLASIGCNFYLGIALSDHNKQHRYSRKTLLTMGIVANLTLLGFYKYTDFALANFNLVFDGNLPLLDLTLPLAISFFTFQQIAYLVDSYRGETEDHDFLNYAVFVTFFPQLIAGPIVHHEEMMPQYNDKRNKLINLKNISRGLFIFSVGLFKKVVIADTCAIWATEGFDYAQTLNLIDAWITSIAYTLQLYYDFSGYTDMAVGAALFFNIKLPQNFNAPYRALNIQDFWQRWHITLSRFLKDYVYIPLGGNRHGQLRTYANLMTTFLIGGLWHGAGWTFVFWGFLHGLAIVLHRYWHTLGFRCNKVLAWFVTINFINITWVFFRAETFADALNVIRGMLGMQGIVLPPFTAKWLQEMVAEGVIFRADYISLNVMHHNYQILISCFVLVLLLLQWLFSGYRFKATLSVAMVNSVVLIIALLFLHRESPFLYFGF